jgi:ADP-ribose diphosphatase
MNKKLPKDAKVVFDGIIYDVYHWEQEMFDGSNATFERLKRKDTATAIATVGDKIILLEQEQPFAGKFLSLPGGRADGDEKTIDIATRELLEETGYAAKSMNLWKRYNPISTILWNNDYYIARDCKKEQEQSLDSGEKINMKLISFEDFLMLSEDDSFRHNDLKRDLFYFRLHPDKKEKFKKLLFG